MPTPIAKGTIASLSLALIYLKSEYYGRCTDRSAPPALSA